MALRNRYPNTGTLTISGISGIISGQINLGVQSLRKSWPNDNPTIPQQQFWDVVPSTTGILKFYNGSSWVSASVKTYNGTSWVAASVKHYNGSSWV